MSIGRRGSEGSGGLAFITSPSAMPTRSAPSSRALAFTSAADILCRKISSILAFLQPALLRRCGACFLPLFELLHLPRHDPPVTIGTDPADVPSVETGDRFTALARCLTRLGERHLLGRLFRDRLLRVGEMGMIIIAHGTYGETARAIAERADDTQQPLPKAEVIARARHRHEGFGPLTTGLRIDHAFYKFQDGGEAKFLGVLRARTLVDAEMQ